MKRMWINDDRKVISFHEVESWEMFEAEEKVFWKKVNYLMEMLYKIQ